MTTFPVRASAWERHPSVTFAALDEHVRITPYGWLSNPQGLADAVHTTAQARRAAGQRVICRWWQEHFVNGANWHTIFTEIEDGGSVVPDDSRNWWRNYPCRSFPMPQDAGEGDALEGMEAFYAAFAARMRENGTAPDAVVHDFEKGHSYWHVRTAAERATYFESERASVIDGGTYPHAHPSPYAAVPTGQMGNLSRPLVGQFLAEYNQDAADWKAAWLRVISPVELFTEDQVLVFAIDHEQKFGPRGEGDLLDVPITNYGDTIWTHQPPDAGGHNERLPRPSAAMYRKSAPVFYLSLVDDELYEPWPDDDTTAKRNNTRRWKRMLFHLDCARSQVNSGHDVWPWIAPPGYGISGSDTWPYGGLAVRLPHEKLLWRALMAHLEALGIREYTVWNPTANDPHSADTHAWMDAYFAGRTTGEPIETDPIDWDGDLTVVTTGDVTTRYADLYRIETLYYVRRADNPGANLVGFGTESDPLWISEGDAGDAELAAMVAAIEATQGTTITTQEITGEPEPPPPPPPAPAADLAASRPRTLVAEVRRAVVAGDALRIAAPVRAAGGDALTGVGVACTLAGPDGSERTLETEYDPITGGARAILRADTAGWDPGWWRGTVSVAADGVPARKAFRLGVRVVR